jgi:ABC-type glycerol-3-phosphate transport system substrate-binding protein
MNRFARFSLAALAVTPLLAACGGGSDSATDATLPPADVQIIAVEGIAWNASSYTATATDGAVDILGRNESSLPHNLYVVDSSGTQQREFIDLPRRGDAEVQSFPLAPGEYTVLCLIPGHGNMRATLTVS